MRASLMYVIVDNDAPQCPLNLGDNSESCSDEDDFKVDRAPYLR